MAGLGSACLVVALVTAVYAAAASLYGARTGRRGWVVSGRRAIYCMAGLTVAATVVLQSAFLRSDFSFKLVAEGSSTDTPTFYKATAMWATQDGSLLLWALLLSVFSSAVLFLTRRSLREIAPYATAVLGVVAGFFLLLMVGWENPFTTVPNPPVEGAGLNPLLRHPAMMIHPPMLYTGYVGFSIPFAFAVGALITRNTGADWIRATRRFALVAWTFLGAGILLGALWSYTELGWGGYWGWDPVENASLLPWLTGTAFLHSIMVQEKRGMLKIWNVSLIAATFVLALVGTFLVRSGILESIHAFGASTIGPQFLTFIAIVLVGSTALVVWRLPDLRSEARLDSLLSREAFFLLNNLVLVMLALVVFWGTFFPLISEAVGTEASVGPPWFNRLVTPLALVLVLLMAIGPMVAWRRVTVAGLRRTLIVPLGLTALSLVVLIAFTSAADSVPALVMFCLAALVVSVVGQELWRGASARRTMTGERWVVALGRLFGRNRRRYGGYIVHAGIAVLFLGVAGSSAFANQTDSRLAVGDTFRTGDYTVTYEKATARLGGDGAGTGAPITFGAVLRVADRDGHEQVLSPSRNFYPTRDPSKGAIGRYFEGEATSEVDVRWGLTRDFWTAVRPDISALEGPIREANAKFANSGPDVQAVIIAAIAERYRTQPPPATFRTIVSPLVSWIWIGGAIFLLGALVAAWPSPEARVRRVRSLYNARVGKELSGA
ncbi:MAG: heme lyase CcmF/NrfE family subunit [Thermoleophilaceae bacterium]